MKRTLLTLVVALAAVLPTKAFDYETARQQAWFLTDKMAYELNLTAEQYDRAYQINLDYLLSVNNPSDAFGYYWQYRNEDLRYVLFDWQYRLFTTVDYFLRPVRWSGYRWYYPIFDRYRYGYYYFGRPSIYISYRGGFGHRPHYGGHSPYRDMRFHNGPGMRDTHRPPRGGWGEGRNNRGGGHDGRPGRNDRPNNNGGYNLGGSHTGSGHGNRPGGGHYGNGGNQNRPGGSGSYNGGSNQNRPGGSGSYNGGGNQNRPGGSGNYNGGSNRGGGSNSNPPAANPQNSNRNHSGSGGFGNSSRGSSNMGGSRSSNSGSSNSRGGSNGGGRHFGR